MTAKNQGFPQVLKTWGALPHPTGEVFQNLMGWGLGQYMRGAWGCLKCCRKITVMKFI